MAIITIEEPTLPGRRAKGLAGWPLFRLGFRPFYLLAAAFAAASVPLWLLRYFGLADFATNIDFNWHMHEMVFGFAIAVIVGFLFTAGRNWTGLWTPRGAHLAALAGVWIAGRAAMLCAPPAVAAVVDGIFLPLAAWPLYRVLKRSGNKRNMFLIVLLSLLTIANLLFHGARLGLLSFETTAPIHAAILVIVMIESVIGGRVIPGFTANALSGVKPVIEPRRDRICITVTALACVGWVLHLPASLLASLAFAASAAQVVRLAGWKPYRTLHKPLLWILHVSYAWIAFGFLLLGFAAAGKVTVSAAFHVLAVGSMAGLIIGMITRTALGHTGRPLNAGKAELVMYLLVQGGVAARFAAAIEAFGVRNAALVVAATCWSAAFVLYVAIYGPYLLTARVDGREG
jgi:uncharacterized protein involved in response to NO